MQPGEPIRNHRLSRRHCRRAEFRMPGAHGFRVAARFGYRIRPLFDPGLEARIEPHFRVKLQRQDIAPAPKGLVFIKVRRTQRFRRLGQRKGVAMPMEHGNAGKPR